MPPRCVFVSGGTGYIGRALIPLLLARGHRVKALARPGSVHRLPPGVEPVIGEALDAESFVSAIAPADTYVHLIGTPHPNPTKATRFREVDLRSVEEAVRAARAAGLQHFVYVSVAQPAPIMRTYIRMRQAGEALIAASGIAATLLRPWYVLGPGRRLPSLLLPLYALFERLPATRESAVRLGLVSMEQMLDALLASVEQGPPAEGRRVWDVPAIRAARENAP